MSVCVRNAFVSYFAVLHCFNELIWRIDLKLMKEFLNEKNGDNFRIQYIYNWYDANR